MARSYYFAIPAILLILGGCDQSPKLPADRLFCNSVAPKSVADGELLFNFGDGIIANDRTKLLFMGTWRAKSESEGTFVTKRVLDVNTGRVEARQDNIPVKAVGKKGGVYEVLMWTTTVYCIEPPQGR